MGSFLARGQKDSEAKKKNKEKLVISVNKNQLAQTSVFHENASPVFFQSDNTYTTLVVEGQDFSTKIYQVDS